MRVVGLISGTSMDAIDVAAADFRLQGDRIELHPVGVASFPYQTALRRDLEAALPPAPVSAEALCRLDTEVGRAFAEVATKSVRELAPGAGLVASHGQTLYHWVAQGRALGTLQIGQPAWIAEGTGLPVVADLRAADVAAGGQGAPLAALFDTLLLAGQATGHGRVPGMLNIGGIANLTVVGADRDPVAFDTGPGNALIDAAVRHVSDGRERFDRDGGMAGRGVVRRRLLDRLLADPYYRRPPPKTTGKEHFHLPYLLRAATEVGDLAAEDLVATVTALTARTVADSCRAHQVDDLVISGGGVHNPVLRQMLTDELPGVAVRPIDELGIPADAKEALFIALTGFLTVHGLPGNLPSATGAARPAVLGCLLPGQEPLTLPRRVSVAPRRLDVVARGST
jgi:anhydro-N-acetylmuramic acid kinase